MSPILLVSQHYFPVERITEKTGLTNREVNYIFKDSRGFMWFATSHGLNRYDGSEWIEYKHSEKDNSLPHNHVRWVSEDDDQNLLFGTPLGIVFFSPFTHTFQLIKDAETHAVINTPGVELFRAKDGNLYTICTPESGDSMSLMQYTGQGQFQKKGLIKATKNTYVSWKFFRPLWPDADGSYWFYKQEDYIKLSINDLSWTDYAWPNSGGGNTSRNMPVDTKGRFWFPAKDASDRNWYRTVDLPGTNISGKWIHFYADNKSNIWIKDNNGSLYKLDSDSGQLDFENGYVTDPVPPNGSFVFEDNDNTLWIPSYNGGVNKFRYRRHFFENYLNVIKENSEGDAGIFNPYAMTEDLQGNIIILTGSNGIYKINRENNSVLKINYSVQSKLPENVKLESGKINFHESKMIVDQNGIVWLNLREGTKYIMRLDPQKEEVRGIETPAYFSSILQYSPDRFMLSTFQTGKLYWFNPLTEAFYQDTQLDLPPLTGVMYREQDEVWSSTKEGVVRFNPTVGLIKNYPLFKGENYNIKGRIFSMALHNGFVWIGTPEGLIRLDPESGESKQFTAADGLSHDIIYTMLPDRDNLWLGTHKGLCRFNTRTGKAKSFYVEDGLTHNEFNRCAAVISHEGKYYLGGMNGVNAFYPEVLDSVSNLHTAALVWTKFSLINDNNNELKTFTDYAHVNPGSPVELMYYHRNITFRFAMLDYLQPAEHKYYYYLDGYEKDWNYGGNNPTVTYLSIPSGSYTLRVKAQDKIGNSAGNELAIPIIMRRAWYFRWWALCLYGMGLLAFFLLLRGREMKRLESEQKARQLEELDHLKSRLYTNITHEFRTPLTVIIGMAGEIQKQPEKAGNLILRNARNLLRLVNQMLDLSKLETGGLKVTLQEGNIIQYLHYLFETFQSYASGKDIEMHFKSGPEKLDMAFDTEKVQQILANLLSNAIKFTPEGGTIEMNVDLQGNASKKELLVSIKDDGIGIASEHLDRIFDRFYQVEDHSLQSGGSGIGLALTKELVQLLGGRISVKSQPQMGTEFRIILPVIPASAATTAPKETKQGNDLDPPEKSGINEYPLWTSDEDETTIPNSESINGALPLLLIIEDNADVAIYIKSCLEDQYQVLWAKDGQSGIELALDTIPDVIISDVMMPRKDGFEVTEFLKKDERSSHIPIILLTAKADVESRIAGLKQGADAYLSKPFDKAELLVRLDKLIELRKKLQARYSNPANLSPLSEDTEFQQEDAFLTKVKSALEKDLSDATYDVTRLCLDLHISRPQLYRKIKALTNRSIASYMRFIRLQHAMNELKHSELSISEIAYQVGFSDPSYFTRAYSEEFGHTPSEERDG